MALELNEIISRLERLLINDLASTFEELKKLLRPQEDAWDSMVLMEARHYEVKKKILRGTISEDRISLELSQVREDLLHFIQDLKAHDLQGYEPTEEATAYEGHLLYKIPLTMNQNEKATCLVRIAIEKAALIKHIEMTDEVKQEGLDKVSDVMMVELVDPSSEEAFEINTFNEPDQLILKKGYTEWRFDVTPLKEGVFPLLLKVAVLIMLNGKERKREITLEKEIKVMTLAEVPEEGDFVESGIQLTMATGTNSSSATKEIISNKNEPSSSVAPSPRAPSSPEASSRASGGGFRRFASALSVMLVLVTGFFFMKNNNDPTVGNPTSPGEGGAVVVNPVVEPEPEIEPEPIIDPNVFENQDPANNIATTNPPQQGNAGGDLPTAIDEEIRPTAPGRIELASPEAIFDSEEEGGQYFASVEMPPQYSTVKEMVIVQEASTRVTTVPAVYSTKTERVLIPNTDPPQYRTVTKRVETRPAKTQTVEIPATYKEVEKRVVTKPSTLERKLVLGGDKLTPEILRSIQLKLFENGLDVGQPGDPQNVVNEKFKAALIKYQKDNGLPVGNLDFETLRKLGVEF